MFGLPALRSHTTQGLIPATGQVSLLLQVQLILYFNLCLLKCSLEGKQAWGRKVSLCLLTLLSSLHNPVKVG